MDNTRTAEEIEVEFRANRIAGLRAMADALEAHPNMPVPSLVTVTAYVTVEQAREARQGLYGWVKSNYKGSSYITFSRQFCEGADVSDWEGVKYYLEIAKSQTCQKVQVGTRHVEAIEAHDEPVFEWDCTDTDQPESDNVS